MKNITRLIGVLVFLGWLILYWKYNMPVTIAVIGGVVILAIILDL